MILRRFCVACTMSVAAGLVLSQPAHAQIPGQNVNMVAGTTWPDGDPFLQRQNEGSKTVTGRNPLHLAGGANDYRTVDLPGLPDGGVTGDAWLSFFKSTNGGLRWTSTLVPGYPQDTSPEGLASPLKGFQAGADPWVRAGSHGLLYYGGLAFNRGEGQPSAIFVARYQDLNNKENGDPFQYQRTSIVARNLPGDFLDKPTIAVDIPRAGSGTCNVNGVQTPAGAVYAAWTVFLGPNHPHGKKDDDDDDREGESQGTDPIRSRIVFSRSADCGVTWSNPVTLSDSRTNQSASIAIDPRNGHIYVAWRQFATWHWIHAIKIVKSTDGGRTFSRPIPIWGFFSFDQGTTPTSFRTNSYPTVAVDHTGRVYVAWSARGYAPGNHHPVTGDTRIVVSTSQGGLFWTFPRAIDNFPGRGHQIMPSLTYAGGKLQLVYYDLREDVSGFFERFVDELSILQLPPGTPGKRRHTVDVRTAQADPGIHPQFASYAVTPTNPSAEASRYLIGSRPGSNIIEQLQFSPPNLPLFALGTTPFIGDYIDSTAQTILPPRPGQQNFRFSGPGDAPVFHLVWTDNRDVRPPTDGNWANYTPPTFPGSGGPSIFDPTQLAPACVPGQAGMRNQNIYTSRISPGLVAGSPGNAKGLSTSLPRAFVVFAQNTTQDLALYRFSIRNQPPGGTASFEQFALLTSVDVLVPPGSSAARTVSVTSSDPRASVIVDITQVAGAGVPPPPPEGRASTVVLNPDISNPDISNPDISNPDISNPDISNAEVHNPDISNPDISNPDISNPDISNPDISNPDISNISVANPDISNPDISNPDISNPDISNPDISNPDISNPDISNGSISDNSYNVTNNGNTTTQYQVDLNETDPVPGGIKLQLVIHRIYQTPVVDACTLKLQTQNQVLLNLPRPLEFNGVITFWLEPGERIKLTLRVVDTDRNDGISWDPRESLTVTVTAGVVNWDREAGPDEAPASDTVAPAIANDDAYETRGTLDVEAPGVLANDEFDTDLDVTAVLVAGPDHAAAFELNSNGSFTYTPDEDFSGTDTFTYRLGDDAISNVATVTIEVVREGGDALVVTNTNPDGGGSLRSAIAFANDNPNGSVPDTISFNIPGTGPTRIRLSSLLPVVTEAVVIDATTQPGYNGTPIVIIDGENIDLGSADGGYGLVISAGDSVVRGLAIVNTPGKGLILTQGGNNVVQSNWIGVDPQTGAAAPTREAGIAIMEGSSNNVIGVTCPVEAPCVAAGANLISGNLGAGVQIYDGNGNAISGNRIGTTLNGLEALPNAEGVGISEGLNNRIGGTRAGEGNIISGNLDAGVAVRMVESQPSGTVIAGNFIGIGSSGDALGNGGHGVLLLNATGTVVGGTAAGARNVISGNTLNGVVITGTQGNSNTVRGNYVGISPDGVQSRGNGQNGVLIESASNVVRDNAISRNGQSGVRLLGPYAQSNVIQANLLGTDAKGSIDTFVVGNVRDGVTIAGASNNLVGGLEEGQANVIADNDDKGVNLFSILSGENPLTPLGNRIFSNSIYGNTGLDIDLGDDGQTPNDGVGDKDFGPNRLQNFPTIEFFRGQAGELKASVTLVSQAALSYTIQLFRTAGSCGGPKTVIDTRSIIANSDGFAVFSRAVPEITIGDGLWATATNDVTGDTSEMQCFRFAEY